MFKPLLLTPRTRYESLLLKMKLECGRFFFRSTQIPNRFQLMTLFRQTRYINLMIAPMTTLMTLKPPLEMPLLKLPRQQLGAPKQRNRNFVRSWHAQMLTKQHRIISRKKQPSIASAQYAHGKFWPCFHRQQSPREVFWRPHSWLSRKNRPKIEILKTRLIIFRHDFSMEFELL